MPVEEMIAFIRARLDETEHDAQQAIGTAVFRRQTGRWVHRNVELSDLTALVVFAVAEGPEGEARTQVADLTAAWEGPERAVHIARHDPARVLAEVDAQRKIVAHAHLAITQGEAVGEEARAATAFLAVAVLQQFAALDADHPDYDPGWAL